MRKVEQPEQIGYRRTVFANLARDLFLSHKALVRQRAVAFGLFDGIEILALEVLDKSKLQQVLVGHVPDDHRHTV